MSLESHVSALKGGLVPFLNLHYLLETQLISFGSCSSLASKISHPVKTKTNNHLSRSYLSCRSLAIDWKLARRAGSGSNFQVLSF